MESLAISYREKAQCGITHIILISIPIDSTGTKTLKIHRYGPYVLSCAYGHKFEVFKGHTLYQHYQPTSAVMVAISAGEMVPAITCCLRVRFLASPKLETRLRTLCLYLLPVSPKLSNMREGELVKDK